MVKPQEVSLSFVHDCSRTDEHNQVAADEVGQFVEGEVEVEVHEYHGVSVCCFCYLFTWRIAIMGSPNPMLERDHGPLINYLLR